MLIVTAISQALDMTKMNAQDAVVHHRDPYSSQVKQPLLLKRIDRVANQLTLTACRPRGGSFWPELVEWVDTNGIAPVGTKTKK